jgi:hypothetical protein
MIIIWFCYCPLEICGVLYEARGKGFGGGNFLFSIEKLILRGRSDRFEQSAWRMESIKNSSCYFSAARC